MAQRKEKQKMERIFTTATKDKKSVKIEYGDIISDPTSDEARKLISKRVCFSTSYRKLKEEPYNCSIGTLDSIRLYNADTPFKICSNGLQYNATFIRGIIKEEPTITYMPYRSLGDLMGDWVSRRDVPKNGLIGSYNMPTIWVKKKCSKNEKSFFTTVCGGNDEVVFLSNCHPISYAELLDNFTFLDGSACGKLCGGCV